MNYNHCPYCNSPINSSMVEHIEITKKGSIRTMPLFEVRPNEYGSTPDPHKPYDGYDLFHYVCPDCGNLSILFEGKKDPFHGETHWIMPHSSAPILPDYIPDAIRQDFTEAFEIAEISPKASATLARRCLQGMIRNVFGVKEKNLYAEISAIQGQVSPREWSAIDSVRQIGNIGAHMEADVNTIIEVDPEEAQTLLLFIDHLINEWYIKKHADEELFRKITEINDNKQQQRKQPN